MIDVPTQLRHSGHYVTKVCRFSLDLKEIAHGRSEIHMSVPITTVLGQAILRWLTLLSSPFNSSHVVELS